MVRYCSLCLTICCIFVSAFVLYYFTLIFMHIGNENIPTLIWWTSHDDIDDYLLICHLSKCMVKTSQSGLGPYDPSRPEIIIFYGTDFDEGNIPAHRPRRDQLWAVLHEESPMNNYIFSHLSVIQLFNYTSTFRRESDLSLTTLHLPNLEYLTERKPVEISIKNNLRRQLAPIVYIQSNCDVPSDRDNYVSQLSKYIAVDSYGKCLHNKDLPSSLQSHDTFNDAEFINIISQYKFHLAYENAICDDYMTEKLFRAFHVGSVPIYKGSPKVLDWTPTPNSVILIDDFSSPKELADFISVLDSNDSLYEEFISFKLPEIGVTNNFLIKHLRNRKWGPLDDVNFVEAFQCYLCDQLVESVSYKNKNVIKFADNNHFGCPSPTHNSSQRSFDSSESVNDRVTWTQIYQQSLDKAENLRKRVEKMSIADAHVEMRDQL